MSSNKNLNNNSLDIEMISENESSLENEIKSYDEILNQIFNLDFPEKEKFNNEFKTFLTNQINKINNFVEQNLSNYLYAERIINIKIDIYKYLQNFLFNLLRKNYNVKILDIVDNIYEIIYDKIKKLSNIIENFYEFNNSKKINFNNNLEKNYENKNVESKNNFSKSKKIINLNDPSYSNIQKNKLNFYRNSNIENTKINTSNFSQTFNSQKINPKNHSLTIEQLLSLINEIYKSKSIFNKKNEEIQKPLETLENYLKIFLKQKFGLNELVIEYFNAIIQSIKKYSKINSEIQLFGLILKNEIEENSINISNQIKNFIDDNLRYIITEKNYFLNKDKIDDILNNIKNGFIDEEIWNFLVELYFNNFNIFKFNNDNNNNNNNNNENNIEIINLKNKIYDFIEKIFFSNLNKKNINILEMSRDEKNFYDSFKNYQKKISYKDFYNILLDFHIKNRLKYLKNIKKNFKKNDSNKDGILNKKEIYNFFKDLNLFDENHFDENFDLILKKLPFCDKYNFFSFSDVVMLLENEMVFDENQEEICVLDLIAKKG